MENTVVFTISRNGDKFNLTHKNYKTISDCGLTSQELLEKMNELAEIINNTTNSAVLFEME